MTYAEYAKIPGITQSALFEMRLSPEKFKWRLDNPEPPTPALLFGAAFHKLVLEPQDWENEYVVAPKVDRRTKDGKATWEAFQFEAGERELVNDEDYGIMCAMRDKLLSIPFAVKLLAGESEVLVQWRDGSKGELCKGRFDVRTVIGDIPILVDLKSCANASTDEFMRSAIRYGYDFQAATYCSGAEKVYGMKHSFVFIAIEKDPPYAVNIMQADDVFLKRGEALYRQYLELYIECASTGNWWGYNGKNGAVNTLSMPKWATIESEE